MKKLKFFLVTVMMLATNLCAQDITLIINNKTIESEVKPIQESGTTLVPIRIVGENLGAKVDWNKEMQKVTIVKADKVIELVIGSKEVKINGVVQTLQCAPKVINGTTMVPIRLISESFGSDVTWNQETSTVDIEDGPSVLTGEIIYTLTYEGSQYIGEATDKTGVLLPDGKGVLTIDSGVTLDGIFENGHFKKGVKNVKDLIIYDGTYDDNGYLSTGTMKSVLEEKQIISIIYMEKGFAIEVEIYDMEGNLLDIMGPQEFYDSLE